jgi:hypothetical protein
MPIFLKVNGQTMQKKSIVNNSFAIFPKKHYTLAGFEPESSVHDVDAMSTTPRRKYQCLNHYFRRLSQSVCELVVFFMKTINMNLCHKIHHFSPNRQYL